MNRRPVLFSLWMLLLSACGSGDPARVTFAPALGVDLAAMDKRPSGLYVLDQEVGTGAEATPGRSLTVHYSGWLSNGSLFDSSRDRGEPLRFDLGKGLLIQGWEEGLIGMRVGGKRRLVIPSELGYGPRERPGIPPDSVLVFDIELLLAR